MLVYKVGTYLSNIVYLFIVLGTYFTACLYKPNYFIFWKIDLRQYHKVNNISKPTQSENLS